MTDFDATGEARMAVAPAGAGIRFLLINLALQNLGRRKARSLLLFAAVAICAGSVFTGAVLMRSIERSMDVGFTRLGADMLVVPEGTLTNITAALLTAEPTDLTLDAGMLGRPFFIMARVEGIPLPAIEAGVPWSWHDFAGYLDQLDARGTAVNAGTRPQVHD